MASISKSEINLEISSGFFRISTEDVVYNITVLDSQESGATKVVKKIVAEETGSSGAIATELAELPPDIENLGNGDDYYKQVSNDLYHDIGELAKSLSSTMLDMPAEDRKMKRVELDEAGEKIEDAKAQLHDIVSMTEKATMEIMDSVEKVQGQTDDVKELLSLLKDHQAFSASEEDDSSEAAEEEPAEDFAQGMENLQENVTKANEIVKALLDDGGTPRQEPSEAESEKKTEKKTRYLFPIDTIFQTIYELCTNETVKGHITSAREQAEDIFNKDAFIDEITEKVSSLEADADNFYTVPLSDVLGALLKGCTDKKIQNLLKKMDAGQADIFIDQSLPLEVPPTEEVEIEVESDEPPPLVEEQAEDTRITELAGLMEESLTLVDKLKDGGGASANVPKGMSMMSIADQQDIFDKIAHAFESVASICDDVTKITEALSFQDLSGQQIMKIIKLLSDFQVQLLAIVVSFGSQLKHKEEDSSLTAEQGKELAQKDVDSYLGSLTTEEVGGDGSLDQDSVNHLLEELGF